MEALGIVAAVAIAGGALITIVTGRRLGLVAGTLVVLLAAPLAGRPFPASTGWAFVAGGHLALTVAGTAMLSAAWRRWPPSLAGRDPLGRVPGRVWIAAVVAAGAMAVAVWPLLVESLDPRRVPEVRASGWLEPARWALGGAGAAAVGAARLLAAPDAARIAAGAALLGVAAWLVGVAAGGPLPDAAMLAVSAVLPLAAFAAVVHVGTPADAPG